MINRRRKNKQQEEECRKIVRQIKRLKPPPNQPEQLNVVCMAENCAWKPQNGSKCVLPKCLKQVGKGW